MAAIFKARASKPDTNKSMRFLKYNKTFVTIVRLEQSKQPIDCLPLICSNLRFQRLYKKNSTVTARCNHNRQKALITITAGC